MDHIILHAPHASLYIPKRVSSIMIEVNRSLYMDKSNGCKNEGFGAVRQGLEL